MLRPGEVYNFGILQAGASGWATAQIRLWRGRVMGDAKNELPEANVPRRVRETTPARCR